MRGPALYPSGHRSSWAMAARDERDRLVRPWNRGFSRYLQTAFGTTSMLATMQWSLGRVAKDAGPPARPVVERFLPAEEGRLEEVFLVAIRQERRRLRHDGLSPHTASESAGLAMALLPMAINSCKRAAGTDASARDL